MTDNIIEVVKEKNSEGGKEKTAIQKPDTESSIEKKNDSDTTLTNKNDKKDIGNKNPIISEIIDWIKVFAVAGLLAFFINNFIIANSTIPTGSMENTIMPGARVFGSRLQYTFGEVQRDDIAIFVYGYTCKNDDQMYRENDEHACPLCGRPDKENKKTYYVKRVIGLPGDHIEIKRTGTADASEFHNINIGMNSDGSKPQVPVGTVYVNGVPKEEVYLSEPMIVDGNMFPEVDVTVPEGHYYVLGDNRNNSMDARYWGQYNMVARDRMLAKVYIKYWPLNDIGFVK
ncbi:signal peptidase I [Oribacterium sp. WCC10]|uniref:signal peptidase I n=1 Tax=Oribacterium sp. WCC10 TaxID=1855343 RepID=UPI0008F25D9E|nr:signal peptidase I [Oribacterium sp. WCC10]SFG71925.1 signal peptidase I [Oribacterium sp. WCC10]